MTYLDSTYNTKYDILDIVFDDNENRSDKRAGEI